MRAYWPELEELVLLAGSLQVAREQQEQQQRMVETVLLQQVDLLPQLLADSQRFLLGQQVGLPLVAHFVEV